MPRNSRLFIVQMIFIDVVLASVPVEKTLMFGKMLKELIPF